MVLSDDLVYSISVPDALRNKAGTRLHKCVALNV